VVRKKQTVISDEGKKKKSMCSRYAKRERRKKRGHKGKSPHQRAKS